MTTRPGTGGAATLDDRTLASGETRAMLSRSLTTRGCATSRDATASQRGTLVPENVSVCPGASAGTRCAARPSRGTAADPGRSSSVEPGRRATSGTKTGSGARAGLGCDAGPHRLRIQVGPRQVAFTAHGAAAARTDTQACAASDTALTAHADSC